MKAPFSDRQSALTSPDEQPSFLDVEEFGDALDDPAYRELLGLDPLPL